MTISLRDRTFLQALSDLAFANPFGPERIEGERRALGDDFLPEEQLAWSRGITADGASRPNVQRLTQRAFQLVDELQPQLAHVHDGSVARRLYEDLVCYALYYRHIAQRDIQQLTPSSRTSRGMQAMWRSFAADYARCWGEGDDAEARGRCAHLFACLVQVRRAFCAIFNCILGDSRPAVTLRQEVWQSIFTHDMRRYRRTLYARMGELSTLVVGPTGTGKELVAQAIALAQYAVFDPERECFAENLESAFIPLNLSALSPTLIESELFGHRRGSFTGAFGDRVGWLESCPPGGAVFLDEIGELDMAIQVKLLRVVQQRCYSRLGETQLRPFRGKLIAATNRDLAREMSEGRFRHDLYFRLCSDQITTPSLGDQLADRSEALTGLIAFLAHRIAGEEGPRLAEEVERWITQNLPPDYPWPGNIRELEQCVRSILVRNSYTPRAAEPTGQGEDLARHWLHEAEQSQLTADQLVQKYCAWTYAKLRNYERTAKVVGLDRRTVKSKVEGELVARSMELP